MPTCEAFLARERQIEELTRRHNAAIPTGVRFSGMSAEPRPLRSDEQIQSAADVAKARAEAFASSPRGRFLACLNELEAIGYAAEAERARAAMRRGFMDPRKPASPGEIACALLVLNPIAGNDAREGRALLAELLLETHRRAA